MDDFEAIEADFAAPFFKIGGRVIERVAEFDQKIDTLRFIESRIRRGECELARKNVQNVRPITWMARLIPASCYQ